MKLNITNIEERNTEMDLCKLVEPQQEWKGESITFDPDSSPEAWKFYISVYDDGFLKEYDFENLCFYEYVEKGEFKGKYTTKLDDSKQYSRLNAIKKDAVCLDDKHLYYEPCLRLSGETDFNFNGKKYEKIKNIIKEDRELLASLEDCSEKHHTLQNFSLMQTVGNMQRLKSRGLRIGPDDYEWMDRLDSFIFLLSKYFENRNNKTLLKDNAGVNYQKLCSYLSKYDSIYDYCHRVYFIQDELVDRLRENGGKYIKDEGVAKEYILLANAFWQQKRDNIESKL